MELSKSCKEYWGFSPFLTPFGTHVEKAEALFLWPKFEAVVERMVNAVEKRRFLLVAGAACSSKSTAWREAQMRLREKHVIIHIAEPVGLDPWAYDEQTIYRTVHRAMALGGQSDEGLGSDKERREVALKRSREERALQCRRLLERANDAGQPTCLAVNDVHKCRRSFLFLAKRLWDDLYGFDRLLSVILVGQPDVVTAVTDIPEISERTEVVTMPGLGEALDDYLAFECRRCGLAAVPFDAGAVDAIKKLNTTNWTNTRDHPLVVANVASRALHEAWRVKLRAVDSDIVAKALRVEKALGIQEPAKK